LPFIAWYFHLFTPISVPTNLVVVPLSSAALACNMGSLATNEWLPWATELFNHAAWWFMVLMIRVSEWAARAPGGAFNVQAPNAAVCLLYYALLVSGLCGWFRCERKRRWLLPPLVLLAAGVVFHWLNQRACPRLSVIPLSGGEAFYFEPAYTGRDLLVDCGDALAADFVVKPFLRGRGVNRLEHLVLTHGDVHNVGGLPVIRQHFEPRRIFVSAVPFRSAAYREQLRALQAGPIQAQPAVVADGMTIGKWSVWHPQAHDRLPNAGDNSIVLRANLNGCRVLLLSDLGKPGQSLLLSRHAGMDLRADVVVSGLPGHTEPLAEALLDAVEPRLIIITDSEYPAPQRAPPRLRERLALRASVVLYTRDTGAVTLTVRENHWELRTMNGLRLSFELRR
jgi:beta-lactamase superfamily II metal-dependent hydrolase